ncbi:translocon-associated protein subunit delta-like [Tribolium madens]|uniref:translocon-associated protein subunit delta-like n=1 Tax=Tribolium madens TaxID=41895 RepID=UPI001CF73045|nr:translocon-associated protein subunit delta-like [Tribolium madens]
MFRSFLIASIFAFSAVFGDSCTKPEITSTSFTTQDATIVTNIAYIADFTLKCSNGQVPPLYAEVNGNIVPVSVVGPNQYQISWTEDTKTARSGDKLVRVLDEDGFAAARKALRAGEDLSAVPSMADVVINYPGAYNGPWLKSELLATLVSLVVTYFAISFKLKVTA